jgi:hypothetical protein
MRAGHRAEGCEPSRPIGNDEPVASLAKWEPVPPCASIPAVPRFDCEADKADRADRADRAHEAKWIDAKMREPRTRG